jgi:uncharacterized membrane protein YccC
MFFKSKIQVWAGIWAKRLGLSRDHLIAIRFSINVAVAATIVWGTLKSISDSNPIWAIASMVAASDPQPEEAKRMFKARLSNVLVGCVVGLFFLLVGGTADWLLPLTLAVTVLISSLVIRIKTMWRQAPITAAVVIASGVIEGTKAAGIEHGLHKVAEVIFGCLVGLIVSWLMSKVWILELPEA